MDLDKVAALAACVDSEDELRIQLSHRLHKEVAGGMVACTSLSEMLRHVLAQHGSHEQASKLHGELDAALRQTLGVVRDITESLYPPVLKVFGFNAALQQLVRALTETFGGSIMLQLDGNEPEFELTVRLNLFRLVEDLLHLCLQDANASWLEITCQTGDQQFEVFVDHDGGAEAWSVEAAPVEVVRIEARCRLIDASLDVSASGAGDRVRMAVRVPLPPRAKNGLAVFKPL
jgi:signal transduction histidine kinase